MENLGKMLSNK